MTRRHWIAIIGYGVLITAVTLAALLIGIEALGLDERAAVTLSFLTLALAQLWHVFNMREGASANYLLMTVSLYLSMFNIFINLLHLLGFASGDD